MTKASQQQLKGKILKKTWHQIVATKSFDSAYLGESYVAEPSMMLNRTLTVNLANLTGDIRQQGINISFMIQEIENGKGVAKVIGYEASPAQLRRLVRRGVERFDDSIICETADGEFVRVKPFSVTRNLTSRSRISQVRKVLKEEISKTVKAATFDDLVKLVISNKLQTSLKNAVKTVFPLKALEIKKLHITGSHSAENKVSAQASEEAKAPQKKTPEKKEAPVETGTEIAEDKNDSSDAEPSQESQIEA